MGLTELFNEWIVERGSAKVQEKHIALFKDQLALADKKIAELTSEKTILKSKLEKAESDLQESQKENKILRGKIDKYEQLLQKPTHNNLLDEPKVNILKLLFQQDNLQSEQIAQTLSLELQAAKYHLEELKISKMIKETTTKTQRVEIDDSGTTHRFGKNIVWAIEQTGRSYLIDNGEV